MADNSQRPPPEGSRPAAPLPPFLGGPALEDEPPLTAGRLAELLLPIVTLASCWPLVFGAQHWVWYALPCFLGVLLVGVMVRRLRRARTELRHEPGRAPEFPPGTPHGRRLSEPPKEGQEGGSSEGQVR